MGKFINHYLGTVWTISSAWAIRQHDCTLNGIINKCGGGCCSTKSYWPPMASAALNAANGAVDELVPNGSGTKNALFSCKWLGPTGCTMSMDNMPITCLLYPLKLNKQNKLVHHNWTTTKKGVCRGNFNCGPMIIDAQKTALVTLFGQQQYDRARADIVNGKDSYFNVSDDLIRQYNLEMQWVEANKVPEPRGKT